ncbi:RagB/SusD family nutrient uptake outer membrane protein [Pedobacter punctiformis]|uniref:RagB/SusD family nutrient uptake outer membrane protein n=1 Tax=Pedobacter punctiformis TaxID=3004097 RepID=A0ABT4L7Q3_9SPHI|nr:RagB/SusD family nutrient uptake outer membrane protein [Pedobacter sp. HCMS5-2]MCZ4243183.1 RagB/SusD family nutrient uptake outer membrane protein [Pedobacter sp. HCMS5-2]
MKTPIKNILLALFALSTIFSCKKYLNVQPEDKVLEGALFSNKQGINSALNGLYISLTNKNLYGENLTLSTVDILAQRYNIASSHDLYKAATYAYADKPIVEKIDAMWTGAYTGILNVNEFLNNLDKYPNVIDGKTDSIYRGEALGIRAMLHFDMLRLFGPRYSTADSLKASIPYYSTTKSSINELLPANKAIVMVINDLAAAEQMLKNDPVIKNGTMIPAIGDPANFLTSSRNYRMNYYAIKALQARVHLYRGDKVSALAAAKLLIQNADKFKWTTSNNALNEKTDPDRVFTTEMILGVQNSDLYNRYDALFNPSLADNVILAPLASRLATVFETNENDFRYNLNWTVPSNGGKTYRTFYKYADVVNKDKVNFRFTIPLVKISEMYYIAAECEPDATTAVGYLNTVRVNRGLLNLASTVNINTELQKEYQKEFFGEGQLFYYYKRKNITSIPNGMATSGTVVMGAVLPLPLSESQYRP